MSFPERPAAGSSLPPLTPIASSGELDTLRERLSNLHLTTSSGRRPLAQRGEKSRQPTTTRTFSLKRTSHAPSSALKHPDALAEALASIRFSSRTQARSRSASPQNAPHLERNARIMGPPDIKALHRESKKALRLEMSARRAKEVASRNVGTSPLVFPH